MKQLMRILFILNLVIVNGLCGSVAPAAGAGEKKNAHDARNKAIEQKDLPDVAFLKDTEIPFEEFSCGLFDDWLESYPQHLNAVDEASGSTLLMLAITNMNVLNLDYILSMKPNVLARNNNQQNVLALLLSKIYWGDERYIKDMATRIVHLMIEQGVDIHALLKWAKERRSSLQKSIEDEQANNESGGEQVVGWKIIALWKERVGTYSFLINFLEREQEKIELKRAREVLTSSVSGTSPIFPPDLGTLLTSSDPRLLKIKRAIDDSDTEKLGQALENNTLLEIKDGNGYTPFLYAAYINRPEMMRDLMNRGANADAQTKDNATAKDFGDYQKLINEGRLERKRKEEEAKKAEQINVEHQKKLLFENIKHYERRSLSDDPKIINSRDENGYTPLMLAASLGKAWYVAQLLYNADTSLKDSDGNTALHLAVINGHFNIANLLLAKMNQQAIETKNKGGFTAYDLAIKYADKYKDNAEFQKLMEAFQEHNAKK